jgi:hypothetical protein
MKQSQIQFYTLRQLRMKNLANRPDPAKSACGEEYHKDWK